MPKFDGTPTRAAPGDSIPICVQDTSRADERLVLSVDNHDPADPQGQELEVVVHLDSAGRGHVTWSVPNEWRGHVRLSAAGDDHRVQLLRWSPSE